MDKPLVSVITPVLNGERFIRECSKSLEAQSWQNWEWLVIDNGSEDASVAILGEMTSRDERIRVFKQAIPGAGPARNMGIDHARGDYLCFLDIDDVLPPVSLESRILYLEKHPEVEAVDGHVEVMDASLQHRRRTWTPAFRGNVFPELLDLNPEAFFGLTWMIRSARIGEKRFLPGLSHCEDLHFFMSLGSMEIDFVEETILRYRTGHTSAMSDLEGLEQGYRKLAAWTKGLDEVDHSQSEAFRKKVRRIVFRSWLKAGKPLSALKSYLLPW